MADSDKSLAAINRVNMVEAQDWLKRAVRYKAMVNRKYEGEISNHGDQVTVPTVGRIDWSLYSRGQTLARQRPAITRQSMRIDHAWYMNAVNDEIDHKQEMPKTRGLFVERAMYSLGQNIDRLISQMYVDVANGNAIGTDAAPITLTQHNVYQYINALLWRLIGADIADDMLNEIYCVASPFVLQLLQLDPRYVGGSSDANNKAFGAVATDAGRSQLASGFPPNTVGGMHVTWSNNAPKVGNNFKIIAAHMDATSYAEQLLRFEAHDPSETFLGGYKGLYVSGMHTFEPKAMAVLTVAPPAGAYLVS